MGERSSLTTPEPPRLKLEPLFHHAFRNGPFAEGGTKEDDTLLLRERGLDAEPLAAVVFRCPTGKEERRHGLLRIQHTLRAAARSLYVLLYLRRPSVDFHITHLPAVDDW